MFVKFLVAEAWRSTLIWGDASGWLVEAWRATLVWGDDSGWSGVMIQAGGGLEGYAGLG